MEKLRKVYNPEEDIRLLELIATSLKNGETIHKAAVQFCNEYPGREVGAVETHWYQVLKKNFERSANLDEKNQESFMTALRNSQGQGKNLPQALVIQAARFNQPLPTAYALYLRLSNPKVQDKTVTEPEVSVDELPATVTADPTWDELRKLVTNMANNKYNEMVGELTQVQVELETLGANLAKAHATIAEVTCERDHYRNSLLMILRVVRKLNAHDTPENDKVVG